MDEGQQHTELLNYDKAVEAFERCLDDAKEQFGYHSPQLLSPMIELGNALIRQGNLSEAKVILQQAQEIASTHCERDSVEIARICECMGQRYILTEDFGCAVDQFQDALLIRSKTAKSNSQELLDSVIGLAVAHAGQDDRTEAFTLCKKALRIQECALRGSHEPTTILQSFLGTVTKVYHVYVQIGRHEAIHSLHDLVSTLGKDLKLDEEEAVKATLEMLAKNNEQFQE